MDFAFSHQTHYEFSSQVFLEPHYLRLGPKISPFHDISALSIAISPEPAGRNVIVDEDGNTIDFCWFDAPTTELSISVKSRIDTSPYNPFNFILHPSKFNTLPFAYTDNQQVALAGALLPLPLSAPLMNYAQQLLKQVNNDTLNFISTLTQQIHADFTVEYRETGAPLSPDHTFN